MEMMAEIVARMVHIAIAILVAFVIGVAVLFFWSFSTTSELDKFQSECIRLGYGERDADGNFRLKEKADGI